MNSQLLQDPVLTNSLSGVLLRFRQEPVAIIADVQAMFHQVKVSEKHVVRIKVHIFEATLHQAVPVMH